MAQPNKAEGQTCSYTSTRRAHAAEPSTRDLAEILMQLFLEVRRILCCSGTSQKG